MATRSPHKTKKAAKKFKENSGPVGGSAVGTHTGMSVQHNTVVNSGGLGIKIDAGATGALCRNNLSWSNNGTYTADTDNLTDNGTHQQ